MNKAKRFDWAGEEGMEELPTGAYVRFLDYIALHNKMAIAEQRNAETSVSLQLATRLLASGLSVLNPRAGLAKNVRDFLDSQRKPTESGASE